MNYQRITNSSLDPNNWPACATGQKYRGSIDKATGLPHGLGIIELQPGLLYAGEWRQGKRHGRGFLLRLEDRSREEKYWHRYSYEQVMETAEFDSCGRVVSTGPSGEWRTSHVEEYAFAKEQDGLWQDDALVCDVGSSLLRDKAWSGYTLMQRDLLLTSGDYPVDWTPWHSSLAQLEADGTLKVNGYAHFITPYDNDRLLVLNYSGAPPIVVPKDGLAYWDQVDVHHNHTQHFYALYPTGAENEFDIADGTLRHCTVRQPHVEIPWGVTEVAPECFAGPDGKGQEALYSVTVPKTCKKIGRKAFAHCKNLQQALVLGQTDIGDLAFVSCHQLRHIELWRGVCRLGHYCLANCDALPYVFIPITVGLMGQGVAAQQQPDTTTPIFYCQRKQPDKGWDTHWNLAYRDTSDGDGTRPDTFHKVVFGATPTKGSQHFLPHAKGKKDL